MDEEKVLTAVKRLLALNATETEIITNLKEVGVSEFKAKELIEKAKGMPLIKEKKEVQEDSGKVLRKVAESLAETIEVEEEKPTISEEEIATARRLEEKKKTKTEFKEERKPLESEEKTTVKPTINLTKLWEKGIITTVNQKLEEMSKLKEEIETILDEKVEKATEKERDRLRILLDSQRTLLIEKVNAALKEKEAEISQTIDFKINELKSINQEIKQNLAEIISIEQENKALMQDLEEKKNELTELKKKLVTEMNTEITKTKIQAQDFLDKAKLRITEIDDRVNKTLELESKIAEGILEDAKAKIDSLALEKSSQLDKEIKTKIKELEDLKKKLDVKEIEKSLTMLKEESKRMATITAEEVRAEVSKKINTQEIEQLKEELSMIKEQFLKVVDKKVEEFNKNIKKFNEAIEQLEKESNEKLKLIDEKIKELNSFEQNFAKEMGLMIDELIKQKKS